MMQRWISWAMWLLYNCLNELHDSHNSNNEKCQILLKQSRIRNKTAPFLWPVLSFCFCLFVFVFLLLFFCGGKKNSFIFVGGGSCVSKKMKVCFVLWSAWAFLQIYFFSVGIGTLFVNFWLERLPSFVQHSSPIRGVDSRHTGFAAKF